MRIFQNIFGILENSVICNISAFFILNFLYFSIIYFHLLIYLVYFLTRSFYLRTIFSLFSIHLSTYFCTHVVPLIDSFVHPRICCFLSFLCMWLIINLCFIFSIVFLIYCLLILFYSITNYLFINYSFFICRIFFLFLAIYYLFIDLLFIFHSFILLFLHLFCIV